MLDDANVLKQRDPHGALGVAATIYEQCRYTPELQNPEHDGRRIQHVVVAGMGGSALAADVTGALLAQSLTVPYQVIKGYELPAYVTADTLVVAISYSGNTEETIHCLHQAIDKPHSPAIATLSAGGQLEQIAGNKQIVHASIPNGTQPRMATIQMVKGLLKILQNFSVIDDTVCRDITEAADWLHLQTETWEKETETTHNYAKQLALLAVGKTGIFYGSPRIAPLAYKWKISWNENAKNVAFCNLLPEMNHNEFIGWSSHPVEKPFAVFDVVSDLEDERVTRRFALTDRLLSGMRPKANTIHLAGDSLVQQMLWGLALAEFTSIYLGILNGVNPTPVELVEKFKAELNA